MGLTVEWISDTSFTVNWWHWNKCWGEGKFRQASLHGVEGLLEDPIHGILVTQTTSRDP